MDGRHPGLERGQNIVVNPIADRQHLRRVQVDRRGQFDEEPWIWFGRSETIRTDYQVGSDTGLVSAPSPASGWFPATTTNKPAALSRSIVGTASG